MQKVNQIFVFIISVGILLAVMCTISSAKEFCGIQLAEGTKITSKDLKPMQNGLKARNLYDGAIDGRFGAGSCLAFHQFYNCEKEKPPKLGNRDINTLIFFKDFNSDSFQDKWQCYRQNSYVLANEKETKCPRFLDNRMQALGPNAASKYIKKNQKLLKSLKIYNGKEDGRMSKKTKVAFLTAELLMNPFDDKIKACLSELEYKWFENLKKIKNELGVSCSNPNNLEELNTIKELLSDFNPKLKNISLDGDLGKRQLVRSIAEYEVSASKLLARTNQIKKDCRLDNYERAEMADIIPKLKTLSETSDKKIGERKKEKGKKNFKDIRIKKALHNEGKSQKPRWPKLYTKFEKNVIPSESSIYKTAEFTIEGDAWKDRLKYFVFVEKRTIESKIPKELDEGEGWTHPFFRVAEWVPNKKIRKFYNSLSSKDKQVVFGICSAFSKKEFVKSFLKDANRVEGYSKMSDNFWLNPKRAQEIIDIAQKCRSALPKTFNKSNRIAEAFNQLPQDKKIKVQNGLKNRGLYTASIDGAYGPSTKSAIEKHFGRNLFKKDIKQELLKFIREKNIEKVAGAIRHREKELKEALSLAKKLETEKLEAEEQIKAIESKREAELERIRKDKEAAIEAEREKIKGLESALRVAESRARLEAETVVGERDQERRLEFEKLQEEREAALRSERERIKVLEEALIKKEENLNLQRKGEIEELEKAKELELREEKRKIMELERALSFAEKKATQQAQQELKRLDEERQKELEKIRAEKEEELVKEREKIEALEQKLAKLSSQKDTETLGVETSEKIILPPEWMPFFNFMPLQQNQFCQLTDRFFEGMDKAIKSGNEIKVNMVHKERQENFDGLLPGGEINNWIFKVIKVEQVDDGSAAVVLSLHCKSFVGSGQVYSSKRAWREKDNKEWRATIPYDDRRFRELAKLDAGQFVLASGILLEIDAFKPGQIETFYASQTIGEHPLTKGLNLEGELFLADLQYIAALN